MYSDFSLATEDFLQIVLQECEMSKEMSVWEKKQEGEKIVGKPGKREIQMKPVLRLTGTRK